MDCPGKKYGFKSRREFLFEASGGVSGLALAYLLNQEGLLAATPAIGAGCAPADASPIDSAVAPKKPHFKPRATAVISLFMSGGVSHVDTFDPKPDLDKYHGQPLEGKGEVVVRQGHPGPLMRSPVQVPEMRTVGHRGLRDLPAHRTEGR